MTEQDMECVLKYLGTETKETENEAFYQFYKRCMDAGMDAYDADRYAILNTLFGCDIGMDAAREINEKLWSMNIDTFDISSGNAENKELIEKVVTELNLDMDFSDWQEAEYKEYSFFPPVVPAKVRR